MSKFLPIFIGLFVLAAIGMIVYVIANPVHNEKFTEFYILGLDGKADDYPTDFTLQQDHITQVIYGSSYDTADNLGKVTLGMVNQEQQVASYSVELQIDGQAANIIYQGQSLSQLSGITLVQGEKWEEIIGFAPQHSGDNQKVEFFLYKDGASSPEDSLHLWVNVKGG